MKKIEKKVKTEKTETKVKVEKKVKVMPSKEIMTLDEAVIEIPKLSTSKFVGSVNIDIVLNLKEKQKKETIRGNFTLPFSMGDEKKVVVLCEEKDVAAAKKAGAIKAGLNEVVDEMMKGFNDFDIVIATPSVMPQIVKLGKVLGPRGLMPNPKNGTITTDIEKTVQSFKSGRINFKVTPDQGVIRLKVAKVDMPSDQIKENTLALLKAVFGEAKKFASNPFKKVTLSPTMGAGIKLDVNDIIKYV